MKLDRESIITSMCFTMRHDYGLEKPDHLFLASGMTSSERTSLYNQMSQIFDNCIIPYMEFRNLEDNKNDDLKSKL